MTIKEIREQIKRLIEERRTASDKDQRIINRELDNLYELKYILLEEKLEGTYNGFRI